VSKQLPAPALKVALQFTLPSPIYTAPVGVPTLPATVTATV